MDLSVLIPARRERFLRRTVEDVLAHARGDTEVIVVLDGAWADPPLEQHPRVTVVYEPQSIGQRAATNQAARLARGRYVMKLDAHCSVADGFDVALVQAAAELGDDVTQVPAQYNLHAFDWQCETCGTRTYQGPTPTRCACGGTAFQRWMVWQPRRSRLTTAWRFDRDLHFQYWREREKSPAHRATDLPETLSCLGACWVMARDRYWALGGLDEGHGSWGQMGTEVACKTWLSGGRLVTNTRTWFAHMFRTQGGDFGFPYPLSLSETEQARAYSRNLWLTNAWPGQVRQLAWLIDHFAPVPDWDVPSRPLTAGIVYYSDGRLDPTLLAACQRQLRRAAGNRPIVCVSLTPMDFGDVRIVLDAERGPLTLFRQMLAGLEALDTDVAYCCEHDVLYAPEHFETVPARLDRYYYNQATWKVDTQDGRALHYRCNQTSGLMASRPLLVEHYRRRVARVEAEGFSRRMGFEPGTHRTPRGVDDVSHETWMASRPNVDLRHAGNLTASRWRQDQFRDQRYCQGWTEADAVPGWGLTRGRFAAWLHEVTT